MSYSQFLQTISTAGGLVGVGVGVYATFIAHRLHGTIQDVHQTIKDQRADKQG